MNDKEYVFQLFVNYCIKNHNLDAVKLLVAKGVGVNVRGGDNNTTILHHAAKEGNLEITKYLVDEMDMDIHLINKNGATPLHYSDSAECTTFLLDKGASVNIQDNFGLTPLHYAVSYAPIGVAEALIERGVVLI